jgi:vanillate/3-O-methylgallate O-demethylase
MKSYRQWLPDTSYEAVCSIGGSFVSGDIRDYYMTPYELGYGIFVKFDHEFIGREALEKIAQEPQRKKVTFAWNAEDVAKVFHSLFEHGEPYKYIDFPQTNYSSSSYDRIEHNEKTVGFSMFAGYSYNERSMLSLGVVDPDLEIGTEIELIWGEEGGGTSKPTVERHRQLAIRAIVSPAPYSKVVRETYAAGWRSGQK